MKNIMISLAAALALLTSPLAFAQNGPNGFLDLSGTPSLVAKSNNPLVLGTSGTGLMKFHMPVAGAQVTVSNPANGTAATTVASSGTIDTTIFWQRITDAGAITGVIMEDGLVNGQMVIVTVDKDASGSVTMAAEGTSNVCNGTNVVLTAGVSALFIYDLTDTCWSMVSES